MKKLRLAVHLEVPQKKKLEELAGTMGVSPSVALDGLISDGKDIGKTINEFLVQSAISSLEDGDQEEAKLSLLELEGRILIPTETTQGNYTISGNTFNYLRKNCEKRKVSHYLNFLIWKLWRDLKSPPPQNPAT